MSNNNPTGINGHGEKNYPPDDVLKEALYQYSKEKLPLKQRLARLSVEHGLNIGLSTLATLNKKFDIPTVKKPPPADIATQAVLEKVTEDVAQRRGVGTIGTLLSNEGMPLPRDFIRRVLRENAPEGLAYRFPGAKRIRRSALKAAGPNHQHHADGHEKLNAQALAMGGVGINIYGVKDQWSSFLLRLKVLPNNRRTTTIGHFYLDYIQEYMCIPVTYVIDKGSETGLAYSFQKALRETYVDEEDGDPGPQFLPVQQVKSVHNTPIEGVWHWLLETFGLNLVEIIRRGYHVDGIYNPTNPVHVKLFYWLWPTIVQLQLDKFVEYWNNHTIRYQRNKPNMSGHTPRHGFTCPAEPAQDCRIPVDQAAIDVLRDEIPVSREKAMQWVDERFEAAASGAYASINQPDLSKPQNGWAIFAALAPLISVEDALYDDPDIDRL